MEQAANLRIPVTVAVERCCECFGEAAQQGMRLKTGLPSDFSDGAQQMRVCVENSLRVWFELPFEVLCIIRCPSKVLIFGEFVVMRD